MGWDKCDVSSEMIITFSWKSTQVCLCATCMLQHIVRADLEHLEKSVQGPRINRFIYLSGGCQMVCYFLRSTACHQQRNPTCWKWCFLENLQQATNLRFISVEVWHPFCSVSVSWMNTQNREGCYFNLHTSATCFGWLTQNAPDTYLNGKCSIFVRRTILWKLVFCHSPEQCEVRKIACVFCLCYRILAFFSSLSFLSAFFSTYLRKAERIIFTTFSKLYTMKNTNFCYTLIIVCKKPWVVLNHDFYTLVKLLVEIGNYQNNFYFWGFLFLIFLLE